MPLVQIKIIEGTFSPTQKQEIMHKVTDAMVAVVGTHLRPAIWVLIDEVKKGDWAMGGEVVAVGPPGRKEV